MSAKIDSQSLQKKKKIDDRQGSLGWAAGKPMLGSSPASTEQAGGFSLDPRPEKRMPQLGLTSVAVRNVYEMDDA